MQQKLLLEVCAFNAASCIIAERAGAGRIELCADYTVGGVTPALALVQEVKEKLSIPVYPIIRPRGGDFLYSDEEFTLMLKNIQDCKALQCEGIATGVHLQNGEIDKKRMEQLVQAAYPMKVTCHRVFDRTLIHSKRWKILLNVVANAFSARDKRTCGRSYSFTESINHSSRHQD